MEPFPDSFLPILLESLHDYLQVFSGPIRQMNVYLLPLDDPNFYELCTDLYYELIRRGKATLECSLLDRAQQDVPHEKIQVIYRLGWIPTNIFNGLARDVYYELCSRFPWISPLRSKSWKSDSKHLNSQRNYDSCDIEYDVNMLSHNSSSQDGIIVKYHQAQPDATQKERSFTKNPELADGTVSTTLGPLDPMDIAISLPEPSINIFELLIYLDSIKNRFQNHPVLYHEFLDIIDDFTCQRSLDLSVISQRVTMILTTHPALIEGFYLLPLYSVEYFLRMAEVTVVADPNHSVSESDQAASESFSKNSPLCLDGQIDRLSKYAVASGGFADVWMGWLGSKKVAIKITRAFSGGGMPISRTKIHKRLWREYLAWSRLRHKNVLECLGFSYNFTPQSEYEIPSLISPWMGNGTVLAYLEIHPAANRMALLLGIASGLFYLHDQKPEVVHGDLRAGNILVSDAGIPCLTDFGLSRIISDIKGTTTSSEPAGSVRWMSPELLHDDRVSKSSDIWAYGMTILEVVTGERPYNESSLEPVVLRKIIEGTIPLRPPTTLMTDNVWELCQWCWHLQPTLRPTIHEVMASLSGADTLPADGACS
ncbi:kinase-like protein [Ramaria rubella]|nr:kinase-like protein [Ramaria rubella]